MRILRAICAASLLTITGAHGASAAVWEDTEEWSEAWEDRYTAWVAGQWRKDATTDPNDSLLFGLELDCADAIYTMRAVFAYENKLPFIVNDPRRWGKTLSNRMTDWDGRRDTLREELDDGTWRTYKGPEYTERDKVRAFINFVNDLTTTESLPNDTYPVALSDIRAGDMFVAPNDHAYMISRIEPTGAMTTLSASSPRANREFAEIADFPSHMPKDKRQRDGYRRFKPQSMLTKPAKSVPGADFSQWQAAAKVDFDPAAFAMITQDALATIKEPLPVKAERIFTSLCDYAVQRVEVVNIALDYVRRMKEEHNRTCMGIGEYGEYSTPGRDKKMAGMFKTLRSLMSDEQWSAQPFALQPVIAAIFSPAVSMVNDQMLASYCSVPVDIEHGRSMNLRQIWTELESGRMSSDPHAPLDYRWGIAADTWKPGCKVAVGG